MENLEQSGSRIPNAWSVKLTFWLRVTFYLRKTENRTKTFPTQLSYYCFNKGTIFAKKKKKKADFLPKNGDISKIEEVSVLNGICFEIAYVRVFT